MVTIDLKQWEQLHVPDLNILKKTTVDILNYFNKCEEMTVQDEKVIEQGRLFRSLSNQRATECQRMALYADDIVSYFEQFSGGRESVTSLIKPLEGLLNEAQTRKDSAEKLKYSINTSMKKVELESRSNNDILLRLNAWLYKLFRIMLLVAIAMMLYITNLYSPGVPSNNHSQNSVSFPTPFTVTGTSEAEMDFSKTQTTSTAYYQDSNASSIFSKDLTKTMTVAFQTETTETSDQIGWWKACLEYLGFDVSTSQTITTEDPETTSTSQTNTEKTTSTSATEVDKEDHVKTKTQPVSTLQTNSNETLDQTDAISRQTYAIKEYMDAIKEYTDAIKYKSAFNLSLTLILALVLGNLLSSVSIYHSTGVQTQESKNEEKEKLESYVDAIDIRLPIIEDNTAILVKFWEQQVNNISDLIEVLKSVDAKKRIPFPPEVCSAITSEWKEQKDYCEIFYREVKRICR